MYSMLLTPGIWALYEPHMMASYGPFSTDPSMPSNKSTVAVIGVHGVIRPRGSSWHDSAEELGKKIHEAATDPNINTVVFDFNTPGGYIAGIPELADQIHALGQHKKTIGVANHMAASAGYWLASQTDTLYATPGSLLGSIGVISTHTDLSKMHEQMGVKITAVISAPRKGDLSPYQPLTDQAKAALQAEVDHYHQMFVSAVGRGRRVDPAVVDKTYGQGGTMTAQHALTAGMVDGIKSLSQVLFDLEQPKQGEQIKTMQRQGLRYTQAIQKLKNLVK